MIVFLFDVNLLGLSFLIVWCHSCDCFLFCLSGPCSFVRSCISNSFVSFMLLFPYLFVCSLFICPVRRFRYSGVIHATVSSLFCLSVPCSFARSFVSDSLVSFVRLFPYLFVYSLFICPVFRFR